MFEALLSTEVLDAVERAYKADPDLVAHWHVSSGSSVDDCILRTVDDLAACKTLKFFVVKEDDQCVGYFGLEYGGIYMPTIFVMPAYRKRKAEFWALIGEFAAAEWQAGIYTKNTPCMKFYGRMGKELARFETPDGEAVTFSFKRSK